MSTSQTDIGDLAQSDINDIDVNALRLDLYDELAAVREYLYRKTAGDGRIRDESKEEIRIKDANAYVRSANATIRLLDAIEDAQVSERLDRVEDRLDIDA